MKDRTTIDTNSKLKLRSDELIRQINIINSYDDMLRTKYYPVMVHSIKLLLQYTIILKEDN